MLREGELLAGKYRIERQLGEGGMGYVMAAFHEQLQQRVAVKFLAESHAKNPDAAARFLREARATAKIQGEHVGRVLDVAELADGSPYMVMEFLLGKDLADELSSRGTFELGEAVDYVLQACEALAEAHSLGLVHRDLKPANLFLTQRPDGSSLVKVLDFGISKALVSENAPAVATALTSAQMLLGSPSYMSPEQARRPNSVDARTDIWSLGVLLYEFLVGTTPFSGDTPLSVLASAFVDAPPSVRASRPDIPSGIEAVIGRCLEKSADQRFQSVVEFAEALAPFANRESLASVGRIRAIFTRSSPSYPPRASGSYPPRASSVPRKEGTGAAADTEPGPTPHTPASDRERLVAVQPGEPAPASTLRKPQTLTDWGKSSAEPRRTRRLAFLIGAGALLLGGVIVWLASGSKRDIEPVAGRDATHAAPPATDSAGMAVAAQPAAPKIEPTVSVSPSEDAAAAVQSAVSAPAAAAQPAKRPTAPPVTRPKPRDPLDGRR